MDAWAGYVGPSLWDDVNSFELAGSNTTDCSLDPEGHSQPPVYESSQRSLELDYESGSGLVFTPQTETVPVAHKPELARRRMPKRAAPVVPPPEPTAYVRAKLSEPKWNRDNEAGTSLSSSAAEEARPTQDETTNINSSRCRPVAIPNPSLCDDLLDAFGKYHLLPNMRRNSFALLAACFNGRTNVEKASKIQRAVATFSRRIDPPKTARVSNGSQKATPAEIDAFFDTDGNSSEASLDELADQLDAMLTGSNSGTAETPLATVASSASFDIMPRRDTLLHPPEKKKRGRPKGSVSKPKDSTLLPVAASNKVNSRKKTPCKVTGAQILRDFPFPPPLEQSLDSSNFSTLGLGETMSPLSSHVLPPALNIVSVKKGKLEQILMQPRSPASTVSPLFPSNSQESFAEIVSPLRSTKFPAGVNLYSELVEFPPIPQIFSDEKRAPATPVMSPGIMKSDESFSSVGEFTASIVKSEVSWLDDHTGSSSRKRASSTFVNVKRKVPELIIIDEDEVITISEDDELIIATSSRPEPSGEEIVGKNSAPFASEDATTATIGYVEKRSAESADLSPVKSSLLDFGRLDTAKKSPTRKKCCRIDTNTDSRNSDARSTDRRVSPLSDHGDEGYMNVAELVGSIESIPAMALLSSDSREKMCCDETKQVEAMTDTALNLKDILLDFQGAPSPSSSMERKRRRIDRNADAANGSPKRVRRMGGRNAAVQMPSCKASDGYYKADPAVQRAAPVSILSKIEKRKTKTSSGGPASDLDAFAEVKLEPTRSPVPFKSPSVQSTTPITMFRDEKRDNSSEASPASVHGNHSISDTFVSSASPSEQKSFIPGDSSGTESDQSEHCPKTVSGSSEQAVERAATMPNGDSVVLPTLLWKILNDASSATLIDWYTSRCPELTKEMIIDAITPELVDDARFALRIGGMGK